MSTPAIILTVIGLVWGTQVFLAPRDERLELTLAWGCLALMVALVSWRPAHHPMSDLRALGAASQPASGPVPMKQGGKD